MFKEVRDVYVYMYIYRYEYKLLWSKEINFKYLPVLPPIPISLLFPWQVFHTGKYFSVAGNEIFVHMYYIQLASKWCLSINDISVVVNTIYHERFTQYLTYIQYPCFREYVNLCTEINKCICMKYVTLHVINYQNVSISFVLTIRVALQQQ
jgi:hypothetical protein